MTSADQLWRGTANGKQFRVMAVDATLTTQTVRDLLDLSPIATMLTGKLISAAALLSLDLKGSGAEVTVAVQGDGALTGASVTCTQSGNVRCQVQKPHLFIDDLSDNFHPGKHLGNGSLSVFRKFRGERMTVGHVELVTGEIAEDLAHFFEQSEQVPSAVNLGILISHDATILSCGGIIIQQMPNADPARVEELINNIAQTPNISDLMDMHISLEEILRTFYFKGSDVDLMAVRPIRYRCNCSRKRFSTAIQLLGREQIQEFRDGIDTVCSYCNKTYHFSNKDLDTLLKELKQ